MEYWPRAPRRRRTDDTFDGPPWARQLAEDVGDLRDRVTRIEGIAFGIGALLAIETTILGLIIAAHAAGYF